ncbi:MAG: dehydrogenase, partial [Verrucomicrobiota bacterium]|nr:dehydrogenase [Verrucomicrobiota bacterium]
MIVRGGAHPNNGAWFRNNFLWVQNEDTAKMPDIVDRRSFKDLISLKADAAKSPQDSLAAIKVFPGFKVELVASEPLIEDPIAFDWSADGKLWVVEMRDYPLGLDGKGKPGGRIRFLEDTNGDGRYDKSTIFLDDIPFPNGIIPWRNGVIISAAPEIFYAEDSDGDGKADIRKTLFQGFGEGNQQHRLNGFDYGLDNWIYGANGDSGGEVTSMLTGKKVNINGRDFRFRPDDGAFESESGETQFGRHRDDWGNWFGNNNPAWLWHYLFPEHYLARNPHLPVKDTKNY